MVIFSHVGINIPYIRVNLITTETCSPEPWKSWFILGESSPNGRTIQVSELLYPDTCGFNNEQW